MDKALKLVVSLLAGVMGLGLFVALFLAMMYVAALVVNHFIAVANVLLAVVVIGGVWKLAYDILFGED